MNADERLSLLRLTMTPGLGPVLIGRLLEFFSSAEEACRASPAALRSIQGIGPAKAGEIATGLAASQPLALAELDLALKLGVTITDITSPDYPPLLRHIPSAPPILYIRGTLLPDTHDRFPVAIVGSRQCTSYGLEQARHFASILARAGLAIVSGGARGIDSSAHRGALAAPGRTIAVLGCGLQHCYPPENADLFEQIIAGNGAVISELPLSTAPQASNFPARNRIISGLSLGVLLIEAGAQSGALITAKLAVEEHGREVMAIPGRIDAPASRGSLQLLKEGCAAMVLEPGDVIALLEAPARHLYGGTHAARYQGYSPWNNFPDPADPSLPRGTLLPSLDPAATKPAPSTLGMTPTQASILEALEEPMTLDALSLQTGLDPAALRREITLLEILRRVTREGTKIRAR
jgi:DNA processing protein